jgi:hypothetical protein
VKGIEDKNVAIGRERRFRSMWSQEKEIARGVRAQRPNSIVEWGGGGGGKREREAAPDSSYNRPEMRTK